MLIKKHIKQQLISVKTTKVITNFFLFFSLAVTNCLVSQATGLTTAENSLVAVDFNQINPANDLEKLVHQHINQYRQSLNLPPLKLDPLISKQARIHSENMAQRIVAFSHDGFEQRVKALNATIVYRRAAENVAYNLGYPDPTAQAVKGWLNSTAHRHNIEGNFNLTGIGIAQNKQGEYYFTQIFILER
jgi:uncharacterized protein YkwD